MDIQWAKNHINTYASRYAKYKRYYDGDHPSIFTQDMERKILADLLGDLRENVCTTVVDTVVSRIELSGFACENDAAQSFLADWFKFSKLPKTALNIHHNTCLYGDCYGLVWPDGADQPRIWVQDIGSVAVKYNIDGEIVAAVKAWIEVGGDDKPILRLTTYEPDIICRYWSKDITIPDNTSSMTVYDFDGLASQIKNHYGKVPVFRFSNSLDINDYARSEIKEVIPRQNILNKTDIDRAVTSEHQSYKQRWATGISIPVDPETGKPIEVFTDAVNRLWTDQGTDAKFGQFDEADLGQFTGTLNDIRLSIAMVSRTPLHLLTLQNGNFPSGEALKTAEAPLISKVGTKQLYWGDTWEEIATFACQIKGIDPGYVEAVWANTQAHSEKEQSETAINKQSLGIPNKQLQRELGYTDEQIDKMSLEKAEEDANVQARASAAFNAQ